MTSIRETEEQVAEYQKQLNDITTALLTDQENSDLQELESNLKMLIQLSNESILEMKKKELASKVDELAEAQTVSQSIFFLQILT